jgi:hypothetical protein
MDACKLPLLQNELHFLRPTVLRGFDFLASWIGLENKNDAASVFPRGDLLKSCDFTTEERRLSLLDVKEDLEPRLWSPRSPSIRSETDLILARRVLSVAALGRFE